jgi:uncharacterized protein (TIGR01777 family)
MKVAITGSHGLIGSALVIALEASGQDVVRLHRWPYVAADLEGADAIVHLAGESISGRWTETRKQRIRESRVAGTRSLAQAITAMKRPPVVFVSASAIGYYGDRGNETMMEEHDRGAGFLAGICDAWEHATYPAFRAHIRTVNLRFGVVLSIAGGALAKMLPPFRLGIGGRIGSGQQYMSWIALEDAVGVIQRAMITKTLAGPVNAVSPYPVTNAEFTQALTRVLDRHANFPMPEIVAKLVFGEMGKELLLASTRVEPIRLIATGYRFRYPELESALRHMLETAPASLKEAHV